MLRALPKARKTLLIRAAALLVSTYPAFVLGYTWSHGARMHLPGGRNGPLDAYRHTLASAVVAFTLTPRAVRWATWVLERGGSDASLMDRHNNHIGADMGSHAHSFSEIEPAVRAHVLHGAINAPDPIQVTWLPPKRWRAGWLW